MDRAIRWLAGLALLAPSAEAGTIHVAASATGAGDGSSWANAFPSLQDALGVAQAGDAIWVARGTYRPDQGAAQTAGDIDASFELVSGVALLGGFDGSEQTPAQRAGLYDLTILEGDLLGNDAPWSWGDDGTLTADMSSFEDNSNHIVTGIDLAADSLLDGFTIRGAVRWQQLAASPFVDPDTGSGYSAGGGVLIVGGAPTLARCTITRCLGRTDEVASTGLAFANGAGLATIDADTRLIDCRFLGNQVSWIWADSTTTLPGGAASGAALYQNGGNVSALNCLFAGNTVSGRRTWPGSAQLELALHGGHALGGAVAAMRGQLSLVQCRFTGNTAQGGDTFEFAPDSGLDFLAGDAEGGAVYVGTASVSVESCTLAGNRAQGGGKA